VTTQADVNAGKVDNTANASGMFSSTPIAAIPASKSVPATLGPALTIVKSATPSTYDHAGQVINYSFEVQNTGNVTISAPFIVFDDKVTNETCPSSPGFLDPGDYITCSASYAIQRADMISGSVTNSAYATGIFGISTVISNIDTEIITATKLLTYTFLPLVGNSKPGVQVLHNSFYFESDKKIYIIGEVINNTNNSVTSVKVVVNFFDVNGHLVGTNYTYMWPLDLPAWEKGCFSISMQVPANWNYYQFEEPTYSISNTSTNLTIFDVSGLYNQENGSYQIIGQVRNDGNQYPTSVGVSGTLYNAAAVPVGCSHDPKAGLNPGQVSSFLIYFWWRDYVDVTNYRLRVAGDLP
jgi:hypothetical protein